MNLSFYNFIHHGGHIHHIVQINKGYFIVQMKNEKYMWYTYVSAYMYDLVWLNKIWWNDVIRLHFAAMLCNLSWSCWLNTREAKCRYVIDILMFCRISMFYPNIALLWPAGQNRFVFLLRVLKSPHMKVTLKTNMPLQVYPITLQKRNFCSTNCCLLSLKSVTKSQKPFVGIWG